MIVSFTYMDSAFIGRKHKQFLQIKHSDGKLYWRGGSLSKFIMNFDTWMDLDVPVNIFLKEYEDKEDFKEHTKESWKKELIKMELKR